MCTKHLPDSVLIFGGKIFSSFRSTVSHKVVLFQFDLDREYLWIKVGTSLPYLIRSMKDIPGLKEHYTSNVFEGTSLYFGQYNNIITCPRKAEGFNIPVIDSFKSIYMITFTQCCHFGAPLPHSSSPVNVIFNYSSAYIFPVYHFKCSNHSGFLNMVVHECNCSFSGFKNKNSVYYL